MKKLLTISLALMWMISLQAQTIEGDALTALVGNKVNEPATQNFFNTYEVKNTAGAKYSSAKYGIDITAKNDTLISLSLYRSNSIYGSFSNKLPKGITFGSSSEEVVKKLGKPTTSYMNSGYAEYEFGKYVMTCWFEQKMLSQITISLK